MVKSWINTARNDKLLFDSMRGFTDWVSQTAGRNLEDPPTALLTLSHHDSSALFFYRNPDRDPKFKWPMVNREFAEPSVAILNGCGTGAEGAGELIRSLNRHGFCTVIATNTEVDGFMAGAFLNAFVAETSVATSSGPPNIGLAYWKAVRRLTKMAPLLPKGEQGAPFGARALKFAFLGNDGLLVCAPQKHN